MRLAVVFGIIATVLSPLMCGHGYDSLVRHDFATSADLAPFATATAPDGGLWLLAPAKGGQHQLVRLDANGNRTAGLFLPTAVDSDNSDRFTIYPLADGGVLELDTHRLSQFERACILRSVTREGLLRFVRNVRQSSCSLQVGKLGRAPYLLSNIEGATVISEDGSLANSFLAPGDSSFIRADFVAERELLLLRTNEARTGYVLSRSGDNGIQLWSNPLENVRFNQSVTVRVLNDGRALVLISDASKLQMRFYSAAGSLLETREIAMSETTQASFGDWASDRQGNHALVLKFESSSGNTSYGAILFTPNGNVLKQIRYAATDQCRQICPILGLPQGFAKALRTQTGGKLVLTSLSPNVPNIEIELTGAFNARIASGSNNTILMTSDESFRVFTNSGNEIAAQSMLGKSKSQPYLFATAIADNGASFVLQQDATDLVMRLDSFAANGARIWQQAITDTIDGNAQILTSANRVCVRLYNNSELGNRFDCYVSNSGLLIGKTFISDIDRFLPFRMRFLADGRLRIAYSSKPTGLKVVDILQDNQLIQKTVPTNLVTSITDISASGAVLLTTGTREFFAKELVAVNSAFEIAFRRTLVSEFDRSYTFAKFIENENVVLTTPKQNQATAPLDTLLLDRSGTEIWSVTTDNTVYRMVFDSYNIYLLRRNYGSNTLTNLPVSLVALSKLDGRTVWTRELKGTTTAVIELYGLPNSSDLYAAISNGLGVQVSRLTSSNGAVIEQRMLGCESANCLLQTSAIDSTGNFNTVTQAQDPGRTAITFGRIDTRLNAPEIGVGQTGLSGAWYTPQISGQGFFLEYFPQNKLVFAPWFTFSVPDVSSSGAPMDSDSVADLRWYTLSGIVEPGAKVAQLEIRRNVAGVFNSAPITESTVVGKATLRAQDCNRATLEFEFVSSEAQGKYGVLPLDRLTGGSGPCQLSNGQILPGRDARLARGGFDGRQSGSWYQPQTSGQGLMMTVQPATAIVPGFFFGGWFTYDAGTPNDPTSQHWLTLSGEIPVNAQSGVVDVAIYRTLGGQLAAVPTQNNTIVGHGTITFSGCDVAVLRYQFDDALIAGAFKARSGQINLSRLGACPAQ